MIIWGGLGTDSKMLVELKANTCALKDSLIRAKKTQNKNNEKPTLHLSTSFVFVMLANAAAHFKDLPFTNFSNFFYYFIVFLADGKNGSSP